MQKKTNDSKLYSKKEYLLETLIELVIHYNEQLSKYRKFFLTAISSLIPIIYLFEKFKFGKFSLLGILSLGFVLALFWSITSIKQNLNKKCWISYIRELENEIFNRSGPFLRQEEYFKDLKTNKVNFGERFLLKWYGVTIICGLYFSLILYFIIENKNSDLQEIKNKRASISQYYESKNIENLSKFFTGNAKQLLPKIVLLDNEDIKNYWKKNTNLGNLTFKFYEINVTLISDSIAFERGRYIMKISNREDQINISYFGYYSTHWKKIMNSWYVEYEVFENQDFK